MQEEDDPHKRDDKPTQTIIPDKDDKQLMGINQWALMNQFREELNGPDDETKWKHNKRVHNWININTVIKCQAFCKHTATAHLQKSHINEHTICTQTRSNYSAICPLTLSWWRRDGNEPRDWSSGLKGVSRGQEVKRSHLGQFWASQQ